MILPWNEKPQGSEGEIERKLREIGEKMVADVKALFEREAPVIRRQQGLRFHVNNCSRRVGFDEGCPECGGALAAATGTAKTRNAVECEASQSGPQGNAQTPPSPNPSGVAR